ncbi:hypothetical protein PTKIN_Ptkin13bG0166800 [Pterospermum kingtungense]
MFMKAYHYALQPINGPSEWKKCGLERLLPPIARKTPGRPKKNRRKSTDEPKKSKGKLSRAGLIMTCSLCGQNGHNRRGCQDRAADVNAEGSSRIKRKERNTSQNPLRQNVQACDDLRANREAKAKGKEPAVDNMPKDKAKPKDNGKEKIIQTERRPIRTRKSTIKGYGLLTNLKTGQQTFWFGSKGILIQESTVNKKGISKSKRMAESIGDGIDSAIMNKKKK